MADELTRTIRIVGQADLSQMQGQLNRVEGAFRSSMTGIQRAAGGVTASLRPLTGAIGNLVGATGAMGSAISNVILTAFNPLALAVAGATLGIGLLTKAWRDSKQSAEEFNRSMEAQDKRIWELNNAYLEMTGKIDAAEAATRRLHRSQEAMAIQAKREKIARMESIQGAIPESPLGFVGRALGLEGAARRAVMGDIEKEKRELAEMEAKLQTEISGTQRNVRQQQRQVIDKGHMDEVTRFMAKLKADLDQIENKRIEITFGSEAAQRDMFKRQLDAMNLTPEQRRQAEARVEQFFSATRAVKDHEAAIKQLGDAYDALDAEGPGSAAFNKIVAENKKAEEAAKAEEQRLRVAAFGQTTGAAFDFEDAEQGQRIAKAAAAAGELNKVWGEYRDKMAMINVESAALGGTLDTTRLQTDLIVDSIRKLLQLEVSGDLTADELERVRNLIAQLKGELDTLKGTMEMDELVKGIGNALKTGISDTLRGVAMGTQDLESAFRRMAQSMLLQIAQLIFELRVLKPLMDGISAGMKPGGAGAGGGGSGWAGAALSLVGGIFGSFFHEGGEVERPQLTQQFRRPSITPAFGGFEMPGTKLASPLGGLKPDEVPAILQVGELVLTKGQQRELNQALAPAGMSLKSVFPEFHQGGLVPTFGAGGPQPIAPLEKFHTGGVAGGLSLSTPIFHEGGLVMNRFPRLHDGGMVGGGTLPGGPTSIMDLAEPGETNVDVDVIIRGSITPERPGMTEKDVVNVVVKNMNHDGAIRRSMRRDRERGG